MPTADLPPLRMLPVRDNVAGHRTPTMVQWGLECGILPRYTLIAGSWLNKNARDSLQSLRECTNFCEAGPDLLLSRPRGVDN